MSDILQQINTHGASLQEVYDKVSGIPAALWHLLITDSAERAVLLKANEGSGKIIDPRLTEVLWVKRKWAVGQASKAQLNRARKEMSKLEEEFARKNGWSWLRSPQKTTFLMPRDVIKVVEVATRSRLRLHLPYMETFRVDWTWQRERLLGLCELSMFTDRLLLAYEDNSILPVELCPIEP